jgi:hypothetical protein
MELLGKSVTDSENVAAPDACLVRKLRALEQNEPADGLAAR